MTAEAILPRLSGVRCTGKGRWVARCPAHEDRKPSLAIRELADERLLIHCFAGCGAGEVLAAVGLDFSALYPPRPLGDRTAPENRPFSAADALRCIAFEALIAATAASNLSRGESLNESDRARLWTAAVRINAAMEKTTWG